MINIESHYINTMTATTISLGKSENMNIYDYEDFKEYGFENQKELMKKHYELLDSGWELDTMETNDKLYDKDILYIIVAKYTKEEEMTAVFMEEEELKNIDTKTKKQIEVIKRRFIKRFKKDFGWYDFEITQNDGNLYQFNYQLGINFLVSGGECVEPQITLQDMFEYEIVFIQDCLDWELHEFKLYGCWDEHKDMVRTLKALITFHKNIVKYLKQVSTNSLEFGTVIKSVTGEYIFSKREKNILLCWDYYGRHNLYNIELDTVIKVTDEKIINIGRVL